MRLNLEAIAVVLAQIVGSGAVCYALSQNDVVSNQKIEGGFCLAAEDVLTCLYVDSNDDAGVRRAAGDLQADIKRVTGRIVNIVHSRKDISSPVVIIGTLGKSALVDQLAEDGVIDVAAIGQKWESFLIQTVRNPIPGVPDALVIVGSDRRGSIYGIYTISEKIGVSPWYWWADVPVPKQDTLYIKPGCHITDAPAVKYRGIFINDEEPCLGPWAREKFGGVNSKMYAHMFELILRLRGNYLWPAMWGKSIYEDDPESARLAHEYGVVLGTSHHEPMTRAHADWSQHKTKYGNGQWNYAANEEGLKDFWEDGIRRNRNYETLITVGMRGDGDEPMIKSGGKAANIALLEKIIADQRQIISCQMDVDPARVPQLWALYKEVNNYYDDGMKVPDDITLLWCDDNWGNIRRLPTPDERRRGGGAGIYYHFDYVGGPRSYKWINTNPLPKVWEQMNMAFEYGADKVWIVNVGDLKPMEIPIEFFLRMAWNPRALSKEKIGAFTRQWAQREFGPEYADSIADIVSKYAKYNGWRKPELLNSGTFSLVNYQEAERVLSAWQTISAEAERISGRLAPEYHDAFYQLVLYPVKASATVVEMYIAAGRNQLYAAQGRVSANAQAERVRELFQLDQELVDAYHQLGGGKWNHMMAQTHIGYSSWSDPKKNVMPKVVQVSPGSETMGVAVEGNKNAWPGASTPAVLPEFDSLSRQNRWIDVFNRGSRPFTFIAAADQPWVKVSNSSGLVEQDQRIWVSVDWDTIPFGDHAATVTISHSDGQSVAVQLNAIHSDLYTRQNIKAFGALRGPTAIAADQVMNNVAAGDVRWEKIPDYGRGSGAMAVFPVTAESVMPPQKAPRLEYAVLIPQAGEFHVDLITAPTLKVQPDRGVRIAVSLDEQPPQVIDAFGAGQSSDDEGVHGPAFRDWDRWVKDNVRTLKSTHQVSNPGVHTLKVWMVDPGVVLERIIVYKGKLPESYFGPAEQKYN